MRFLPVAERELRVAARQRRTYWTRLIAAATAMAFAGYIFWVVSHITGIGSAGRQVFNTLVHLAFVYCLFAGVSSTADCLSREKREGTMGLLFLTDLRSHEIVIGKLAANSLHVIYAIVATVPVFSICLIIGGVQSGEFWRTVLALFNTLFFSLTIGLLVSASSREERRATHTASGIMVIFGFVLPALGEYLRTKTDAVEFGLVLRTLSPVQTLNLSTIPTSSVRLFWLSLLCIHLLTWVSLALACYILPRGWQDRPSSRPAASWRERWHLWSLGNDTHRKAVRRLLLDRNPFFWLATRARLVMLETWVVFGATILVAAGAAWFFRATVPVFIFCFILAVTLHCIGKMQVCAAACERLAQDKESGTLEVLLGTPIPISDILRGQMLALARQFGAVLATVILLDLAMLLLVVGLREQDFFSDPNSVTNCVLLFGVSAVMLVVDAVALGWVGMWQAVAARHVRQARSKAIFLVLVLPWIVLILGGSLTALHPPETLTAIHLMSAWFGLGMLNSVLFTVAARRRLYQSLRILATDRFQPKRGGLFAGGAEGA